MWLNQSELGSPVEAERMFRLPAAFGELDSGILKKLCGWWANGVW